MGRSKKPIAARSQDKWTENGPNERVDPEIRIAFFFDLLHRLSVARGSHWWGRKTKSRKQKRRRKWFLIGVIAGLNICISSHLSLMSLNIKDTSSNFKVVDFVFNSSVGRAQDQNGICFYLGHHSLTFLVLGWQQSFFLISFKIFANLRILFLAILVVIKYKTCS